jgi:low temperature requirement protein LtrA
VTAEPASRTPRLTAALRTGGRVMPLELFFDLVFVLGLTQCTAFMADEPTWQGLAKGLLILGILWWSWIGYSWLTSVVDPEDGGVRLVLIAAMAAMLVVALAIPEAFGDRGLLFAGGYAVVRIAHIVLFAIASRDDPALRRSVSWLAGGTAVGVSLIAAASFADGTLQGALWVLALVLDMGVPLLFGSEGWKLEPEHFAERYGLIVIIALGESIVAEAGEVIAAVLGVFISAALWWLYFDVVALVAQRRLQRAQPGRERNEIARDSYTFMHLPMVAGIVLLALGFKKTLEHVDDALKIEIAVAMLGGLAAYLLAHVAFRWRNVHRFSAQRAVAAVVLAALTPAAIELPALLTLAVVLLVLVALIVYENHRFAELRDRLRHQVAEA